MPFSTPTPLNPAHFLDRAAKIFPQRTAIIDGARQFTHAEFGDRAHRLAALLKNAGAQPGDRVAALCTNSHVMLEMHNGVPMAGCALVPINIRLSQQEIAYILENSGARILIATHEFTEMARTLSASTGVRAIAAGDESSEYETLLSRATPLPNRTDGRNVPAGHQLHQRQHRPPKRRDVHASRRIPAIAGDGVSFADEPRQLVSLDATHVPLQRLVFYLGRDGCGRAAYLPAANRSRSGLAYDLLRQRHPSLRRAHRAHDDCRSRGIVSHTFRRTRKSSPRPRIYGRRAADARPSCAAFRAQFARHAFVWLNRNLRPRSDQRLAAGVVFLTRKVEKGPV